jgi:hypothetical protein
MSSTGRRGAMVYKTTDGRFVLVFRGIVIGFYETREKAVTELLAAKSG